MVRNLVSLFPVRRTVFPHTARKIARDRVRSSWKRWNVYYYNPETVMMPKWIAVNECAARYVVRPADVDDDRLSVVRRVGRTSFLAGRPDRRRGRPMRYRRQRRLVAQVGGSGGRVRISGVSVGFPRLRHDQTTTTTTRPPLTGTYINDTSHVLFNCVLQYCYV